MSRYGLGCFFAALGLAAIAVAPAAAGDDDDYKSLMADCDKPDVERSDIRDCMERARVMDETQPSPQLQRLLTQLERRSEDLGDGDSSKSPKPTASGAPHTLLGAMPSQVMPVRSNSTVDETIEPEVVVPDDDVPTEKEGVPAAAPTEGPHA